MKLFDDIFLLHSHLFLHCKIRTSGPLNSFNPKKAGGVAPRAPPSRLSSAISSSLKVACSYLVTFHFKPSNKS